MKKVRVIDQEIKSRIQVSKEEVDAYYEKHADDFNAEPEVRIQQIRLIIPPESSAGEVSRIQAQTESILTKIKGVKTSPHWSASIPRIPPPRREEHGDIQAGRAAACH